MWKASISWPASPTNESSTEATAKRSHESAEVSALRFPTAAQLLERTVVAPVVFDLRTSSGEVNPELELLVAELATAAYHAASTIEFFSGIEEAKYVEASRNMGGDASVIDMLTRATRDLAVAPHVAWESTSEFRRRVELPVLEYPLQVGAPTSIAD
jgi:hypothetical protein